MYSPEQKKKSRSVDEGDGGEKGRKGVLPFLRQKKIRIPCTLREKKGKKVLCLLDEEEMKTNSIRSRRVWG